jgi:Fe2+/Zn2+ uptake regulation proteins
MNELVKFEDYLRAHGQKMTRPRRVILEAFLGTEGHLTIDDILREAKKIDAGIGQATVFRTIRLIAAAGLAREALQEDGARTFEHLGRSPPPRPSALRRLRQDHRIPEPDHRKRAAENLCPVWVRAAEGI